METLLIHLQRPLSEEEKIPIRQKQFDVLCAHLLFQYSSDILSAEQVSTLFRVSEDQCTEGALVRSMRHRRITSVKWYQ